jgi:hypothetical protein
MAMLLNGADCGPLNPLASMSKTFGRDSGLQRVRPLQLRCGD